MSPHERRPTLRRLDIAHEFDMPHRDGSTNRNLAVLDLLVALHQVEQLFVIEIAARHRQPERGEQPMLRVR